MARRAQLAAIGEVLFDCFPDGDRLGGAPFNFAWHLQGLGVETLFVSRIGADDRGERIRQAMTRHGMDTRGLQVDEAHPTGAVKVTLDGNGGHRFEILEDQAYDHMNETSVRDLLHEKSPALVYYGTLASRQPAGRAAVLSAAGASSDTRLLDVNLRPDCWTEETLTTCLEAATVVKLNDEELRTLGRIYGLSRDEVEAGGALRERFGLAIVVITRGARGACWIDEDSCMETAAPSVDIEDTVGAGDGFAAVTAIGVQAGWPATETLERASEFAARICEQRGACPEEEAFYASFRNDWGLGPHKNNFMKPQDRLYIMLLSVHGLIRSRDLELGRDADTGGQVTYVLELARALASHPRVDKVDVVTRKIVDKSVSEDYAAEYEELGVPGARLVRIPCGPQRYLRKELLWPHMDEFVDRLVRFLRRQRQTPHVIHSHYADAGYVGREISRFLGIPQVHTGHSLGRAKRQRLLDSGQKAARIERQYKLDRRIAAEERILEHASFVVCSTTQEAEKQWGEYENAYNTRLVVMPPGINLHRFSPPRRGAPRAPIEHEIDRFLRRPSKPMILAIARPDPRKNLCRLVQAFGECRHLRDLANLVIVAGTRDDIRELDDSGQAELTNILLEIDKYDLYDSIALPKQHTAEDVPDLYRLAARRRGVFINPALTEPFGLTLLEAAGSKLPIVATDDGGPRDIIANCKNGVLIDALDTSDIAAKLLTILEDRELWRQYVAAGASGVRRHYTWQAHANRYVKEVEATLASARPRGLPRVRSESSRRRILELDKMLICDIDNTLVGDEKSLSTLLALLKREHRHLGFAVATGRSIELALEILEEKGIPQPDVLVSSVGTEIHEGPNLEIASGWTNHLGYRWNRSGIVRALHGIPGLKIQGEEGQRPFKVSYYTDGSQVVDSSVGDSAFTGGQIVEAEVRRRLRAAGIRFSAVFSHGQYLDILPVRASKGKAIRYLAEKWEFPLDKVLVAGDSGNDEEMLRGETLAVVVGNYSPELEPLRGQPGVYFAQGEFAAGILEGIEHYEFLSSGSQEDDVSDFPEGELASSA